MRAFVGCRFPTKNKGDGAVFFSQMAARTGGSAPQPRRAATLAVLEQGELLYSRHCGFCHSLGAGPGGVIPNLAHIGADTLATWDAIVLGGARRDMGMVSFAHLLSLEQSHAIQAWVLEVANAATEKTTAAEQAGE